VNGRGGGNRGVSVAGVVLALALVGAAVVATVAATVAVERAPGAEVAHGAEPLAAGLIPAAVPIPAEAGVFRTSPGFLAIGDPETPRRAAKPRTLHTFKSRRAFPGAPPRIPHGLTLGESLSGACNTCHERGGYSPRFGAYVPVTPHPELDGCLQCHVADDATVGVVLPTEDPNTICRQCHDPTAPGQASLAGQASRWPVVLRPAPGSPPPVIPHALGFRNNCLACHTGPGAVAEIRTDHPDQANCRQCHLTVDPEFP